MENDNALPSPEDNPKGPEDKEKAGKKISPKSKVILLSLLVIAVIAFFTFYQTRSQEEHYAMAYGELWAFRGDLNTADKIPVYPNEQVIYGELFSLGDEPFVKNITIAYRDAGPEENRYYQLQILELVTKLNIIYQKKYINAPGFDAMAVESYEKLPGKIQNPIIALVHPEFATETSIRLDNHVILLNAQTHEDMDLVSTKLLMIALELKKDQTKE